MANPFPDTLPSGQALYPDVYSMSSLMSLNAQFMLVMQTDGNLVLYGYDPSTNGWTPLWATNTADLPVRLAIMQSDGNFVLYDYRGKPLWKSNTAGHPASYLTMQSDGNLVMYQPVAVWSTHT
jgi:hypothetical protein